MALAPKRCARELSEARWRKVSVGALLRMHRQEGDLLSVAAPLRSDVGCYKVPYADGQWNNGAKVMDPPLRARADTLGRSWAVCRGILALVESAAFLKEEQLRSGLRAHSH
jgi:hypothetical protein